MLEFLLWTFFDKDNQWADNPPITQSRWSVSELAINPIPQLKENDLAPKIINNPDLSILSIDLKSFKTLFAKDIYKPRSIASISKLMVYKIIRENHKLDEVVTIDLSVINTEGAKVGFYAYEKLSVKTLLQSILIPSANDGAIALAIWHAGSVDNFVKKMNKMLIN
jgi:D-alanyl-D-alanine carboxypeptidase